MPPSACSKRPRRRLSAPVKAPFSWPNSSDSSSSLGMAEVFSAMNGLAARGECSCSARATSSLPVPDSPVISTVTLERDSRPMARNTCCIAAARPSSSGIGGGLPPSAGGRRRRCAPRGAPGPRPGRCRRAWAGTRRHRSHTPIRRCPDPRTPSSRSPAASAASRGSASAAPGPTGPDMRMSVIRTSGASPRSAVSAGSAASKVLGSMPPLRKRALQHPADRCIIVHQPDAKIQCTHSVSSRGNISLNTVRPGSLSNSIRPP